MYLKDTVFLNLSREAKPNHLGLDLTSLKRAVALLPDCAPANEALCDTLDEIDAIVFHLNFHLRPKVAEDWSLEHYIPDGSKASKPSDEGRQLLLTLGLIKPTEPIKRRI
jgi:hypothetical protein